ncbi:MFS transporter [Gordonia sp. NPDC003376]
MTIDWATGASAGTVPRRVSSAPWWLVVVVGAVVSGVTVSIVYLPQPVLAWVASTFGVSASTAAWTASAVQAGYAIGVLTLVPAGEICRPRRLIRIQLVFTAVMLVICVVAPQLWLLCLLLFLAGAGASVVQLLNPLASRVAPPEHAGNATAVIVAGLAVGIFGGRALATLIAEAWGWRIVYLVAGATVAAMVIVVGSVLDRHAPPERVATYRAMIASLPAILRSSPAVRYASALQFLAFSSFNAAWTVAALYLVDHAGMSSTQAGVFALVGLVAAVVTPFAGTMMSVIGDDGVRVAALAMGCTGALILLVEPTDTVVIGIALAGLATMNFVVQVPNQVSFFAEVAAASPRANAIFIFSTFTGAAIGAKVGAELYESFGIAGTAAYSLSAAAAGLTIIAAQRIWVARKRR